MMIALQTTESNARRRPGSRVAWVAILLGTLTGCGLQRASIIPGAGAADAPRIAESPAVPASVDGPLPLADALKLASREGPAAKSDPDLKPASAPTPSASATEPVQDRPGPELPSPLGPLPATNEPVPAAPTTPPGPSIPPPMTTHPIDLPTALRLAEAENPRIGEARARIAVALGHLSFNRTLLLPTLNAGANYHGHQGNLQRSSGEIFNLSEQAFYVGGGAFTVAAETMRIPMLNLVGPMADILYNPLAARQQLDRTRFDASATANDVLLGVAGDYLDLQAARARIAARQRTESEGAEVSRITATYARTGEGREADARRAETRQLQWRAEIRSAEEDAAVAAARLARRLHLDPSVRLAPLGDPLTIFPLVDLERPMEELLAVALERRPEIAAGSANVAEMQTRLRQEIARPLLPTVWLGFSAGAFGGGSNLNQPLLGNFGGRSDFDARAWWTLQNFGLGNLTTQKRRRAIVEAAVADRGRTVARVRKEVASARGEALAYRQKIEIARGELAAAEDGFRKDLERIQAAAAPPLEVLDNLKMLRKARDQIIDAVNGFNHAQFQLFVALGSPPPLEGPAAPPPPEAATLLAEKPGESERPAMVAAAPVASPPTPTEPPLPVPAPAPTPETVAGPAGALAPVARAHEAAVKAMLDYDRLQAGLGHRIENHNVDRDAIRAGLNELSEAHRKAMQAELDYDRAVRAALSDLDGRPDDSRPQAPASHPPSSDGG